MGESARWGDGRLDNIAPPKTRDNHWIPRLNWLRTSYFPQRTEIVFQQYRSVGLYPDVNPPLMNQRGGEIPSGFELQLSASGTIYYTLDGTDPRQTGGVVNPDALTYSQPVVLNTDTLVKARTLAAGWWSPLHEAAFFISRTGRSSDQRSRLAGKLLVSELNYNPHGPASPARPSSASPARPGSTPRRSREVTSTTTTSSLSSCTTPASTSGRRTSLCRWT